MGFILEDTPEKGHFSIEMRRESFYIYSSQTDTIFIYGQGRNPCVEFRYEDLSRLKACIEEMEEKLKESPVHLDNIEEEMKRVLAVLGKLKQDTYTSVQRIAVNAGIPEWRVEKILVELVKNGSVEQEEYASTGKMFRLIGVI